MAINGDNILVEIKQHRAEWCGMDVIRTKIPGVLIIEPKLLGDPRGFFLETFQAERYASHGIHGHSSKTICRVRLAAWYVDSISSTRIRKVSW